MKGKPATPTVSAIGEINFTDNAIPPLWYKHIRFEKSGRANHAAVCILSELVYWYRPIVIRDESTGEVDRVERKFSGDLLQRSIGSFSEQFGMTDKQVRDALVLLESLGLIRKVLRTVEFMGRQLPNTLFIDVVPDRIKYITHTMPEDPAKVSDCLGPVTERTYRL